ncbi:hypothetical protein CC86DRAFT_418147 [Ophiobolus disseminans]|uniref:Uncharacterized protein n=1 Tax=Ophiobolus disseminans TaxID=1469910 RepID=A0A6A6ZXA3_9PLEO|nr:hypothetical protein CC86DRAFT_418147 [Ophiobolus disseminans]
MSSSRDDNSRAPPRPQPTPQRPRTLLQRVSSSLIGIVPANLRRRASRTNDIERPHTALGLVLEIKGKSSRYRPPLAKSQQELIPRLETPTLTDPDPNCPYNPETYTSFPPIEKETCSFCGFNPFRLLISRTWGPNHPCEHCRSSSSLSHLANPFRRSRRRARSSSAAQQNAEPLFENQATLTDGPRPVSTALAASRIGNPPRRASLPSNQVPSYSFLQPPRGNRRASSRASDSGRPPTRRSGDYNQRPVSPRLHHITILSPTTEHAYVHRSEVSSHLIALSAGSPSPLRRSEETINAVVRPVVHSNPHLDFSNTVYYPHPSQRHRGLEANTNHVIEEGCRGGRTTPLAIEDVLQASPAYQHHSREGQTLRRRRRSRPHMVIEESVAVLTLPSTQTPSTVDGVRIEIRPGIPNNLPRLRGGSGRPVSLGFKLKKWLLTCSVPCRPGHGFDENDSENEEPPRVPKPQRVKRALETVGGRGRAKVPDFVARSRTTSEDASEGKSEVEGFGSGSLGVGATSNEAARMAAEERSWAGNLVRSHRPSQQSDSPINQSLPHAQPLTSSNPIPTLRGGAAPAGWSDSQRLPPTLYWLAGGRGARSITVKAWKQQKGQKKRFGGLLGMAVYGHKAMPGYESEDSEDGGDVGRNVGVGEGSRRQSRSVGAGDTSAPGDEVPDAETGGTGEAGIDGDGDGGAGPAEDGGEDARS